MLWVLDRRRAIGFSDAGKVARAPLVHLPVLGHAEHVDEEIQTLLEPGCQQLQVARMGNVEGSVSWS